MILVKSRISIVIRKITMLITALSSKTSINLNNFHISN